MPPLKEGRIEAGLDGLVKTFFPEPLLDYATDGSNEKELEAEIKAVREHRRQLVQQLKGPLMFGSGDNGNARGSSDDQNHQRSFKKDPNDVARDIRVHMVQSGSGTAAATRFGNVYSRLMTLPIINNKAGILHLMHQLSLEEDDFPAADEQDGYENGLPMQSPEHDRIDRHQQYDAPPGYLRGDRAPEDEPRGLHQPPRRRGLAEVSPARLNRQSIDYSPSKTPREAYSRAAAASRQTGRDVDIYPPSPGALQDDGPMNERAVLKSPTEENLLHDLPFILQGLSTGSLQFSTAAESLALPAELSLPIVSILHALAEPSLLYRNLNAFAHAPHKGLVMQALQSAVESQLRAYLGLISTLEGEIRRCLAPEQTNEQSEREERTAGGAGRSKVGVTLKRCVIWTRDATLGLRLLTSIVEEAETQKLKGGSLISLVHRYADANGDPFVSQFAERLLRHLTRPFYDMLQQWIYDGELKDPYREFFVYEVDTDIELSQNADTKPSPATSVWENKYKMDPGLVPSIVNTDFAEKVFLIGKSLNFIRYSCGDSGWVEQHSKQHSRELAYGDTASLENSVDIAYKMTMAHLIHLLDAKFGIFSHLDALKRYLLLGQGDFIALLIESLANNLDKPAGTQYRHTLTAQLDHAIRGSNAQYDSIEILRRLDARLLELMHSEIGWDVFTLEYKVDAPCDVVVTTWASKQYLAVFNLLWRIKRIEFVLGNAWRRVTYGSRTSIKNVVASNELGADWQAARCTLSAMVHFINQLQYYVMVEVIEASWNTLQSRVRKEGVTLDGMIDAHTLYLRTITHRATLGGPKNTVTGNRDDAFPTQLRSILKAILAYTSVIEGLYSFSITEEAKYIQATVRDDLNRRTHKAASRDGMDFSLPNDDRAMPGNSGAYGQDSPLAVVPGLGAPYEDMMLPSLRKRMMELGSEFRTRLETLLGDLLVQPDQDLKFLAVAMNYNDMYKPVKRRRRKEKENEKPVEAVAETAEGRAK